MRVLLRLLSPLFGLAVAAAGALFALEPSEIAVLGGRKEPSCQFVVLLARRWKRGRRCSTWRLARVASWRTLCSLLPTIAVISGYP